MLDMFYSCFFSMLCRAPWPTKLMWFLTPVQTHRSPIISTLHPRKEIWWQQLFILQLSTFNNVSRGLTRPAVSSLVSLPPGLIQKLWHGVIQKESKSRLHTYVLLSSSWRGTHGVQIQMMKPFKWWSWVFTARKTRLHLCWCQILWSYLFDLKNICAAFDFANMLIGPSPCLPPPSFSHTSLN